MMNFMTKYVDGMDGMNGKFIHKDTKRYKKKGLKIKDVNQDL